MLWRITAGTHAAMAQPRLRALRRVLAATPLAQDTAKFFQPSEAAAGRALIPATALAAQAALATLPGLLPTPPLLHAQAPTLTDQHGRTHRTLRVSLTERCSLRCTYCMPEQGVALTHAARLVQPDEWPGLLAPFFTAGVHKVRLTGGEPLLALPAALAVARAARAAGAQVAITTNALLLHRHCAALLDAGVSAVNISLDTLQPARWPGMTRRPERAWHRVRAAIDQAASAVASGLLRAAKVNVVIQRGVNDDEWRDWVALAASLPIHVRFIEFMPFSGNDWQARNALVPAADVLSSIRAIDPGLRRVRGSPHDTAQVWTAPGWAGAVGVIASMTQPFCGGCDRLRISATGDLRTCLFGRESVPLLALHRAQAAALPAVIASAVHGKARAYGGHDTPAHIAATGGEAMTTIGG